MPFGAAVGGFSYLTLQGLLNTPGVGPVLQVIHKNLCNYINVLFNFWLSNFSITLSAEVSRKSVGKILKSYQKVWKIINDCFNIMNGL